MRSGQRLTFIINVGHTDTYVDGSRQGGTYCVHGNQNEQVFGQDIHGQVVSVTR